MSESVASDVGFVALAISILLSTFRVSVPLVFTAMGGILSERAGVVNIALEGLMLIGAFAAATAAALTHSPWMGLGAGIVAGVALAAVYALFVIQFRADQIVAGTAINLLAFGVTPLFAKVFFDSTGATPALERAERFGNEPLYLAIVLVIAIAFWFKHSRLGLWVSFAGEHPEALSTAGIRVRGVRWFGVLAAGALAGIGGATLSIFLSSSFSRGMTAGRGFMALAALIFGNWKPIPTLFACLFFGLMDALQIRLQGVAIFGDQPIPVQFIQILPYFFTVLVLAGFMGKTRPPKALGAPWLGVIVAVFILGQGCEMKFPSPPGPTVAPSPKVDAAQEDFRSPEARRSRENGELLVEIVRVVFQRDIQDKNLFVQYRSSLNQGASLEGVLNGLTHSTAYRKYEAEAPVASRAAREFFVDELVRLQAELPTPFRLTRESGKPLAKLTMPEGPHATGVNETELPFERDTAAKLYAEVFAKSSLPILKRILIEAVQIRIAAAAPETNKAPGDSLGKWYAETAARLGALRVNFGLELRNRADAEFHRKWFAAVVAARPPAETRDRILWEVLNRQLRVLNHLENKK